MPPEHRLLYEALRDNQAATDQFFAPDNLWCIMGPGGMAKMLWQKLWTALRPAARHASEPQAA